MGESVLSVVWKAEEEGEEMTREAIIGYAKLSMQSIELDNDKDTVAYDFYESVLKILQTDPCKTCQKVKSTFKQTANEWGVTCEPIAETCEDAISRKHLLSEIDDLMKSPWFNRYKDDCGALHFGYIERKEAVEIVRDSCVKTEPPVQPKVVPIAEIRFDDDKLHEIVDEAVKNIEIKYEWIPIKTRPLTEEEKAEMGTESPYMYDCPLPDDGEEVEVTTYLGDVTLDVFCRDSSDGCYFEHYCDDGEVLAWRHKPEPYKAESEEV